MFYIAGLLLIGVPLALLRDLWRLTPRLQMQARRPREVTQVEINLRRTSRGAAFTLLLPFSAVVICGKPGIKTAVAAFALNYPAAVGLAALGLAALFVFGLAQCVAGWRRSAGVRDGLLATRAFIKLAIGAGLALWLYVDLVTPATDRLAVVAILLCPLWLVITGAVRFVLLMRRGRAAVPLVEGDIAAKEFSWDE